MTSSGEMLRYISVVVKRSWPNSLWRGGSERPFRTAVTRNVWRNTGAPTFSTDRGAVCHSHNDSLDRADGSPEVIMEGQVSLNEGLDGLGKGNDAVAQKSHVAVLTHRCALSKGLGVSRA